MCCMYISIYIYTYALLDPGAHVCGLWMFLSGYALKKDLAEHVTLSMCHHSVNIVHVISLEDPSPRSKRKMIHWHLALTSCK